MPATAPDPAARPATAILLGALVVGGLDLLDALVFFGLRGARPERILQSIASGLLGPASFEGGAAAAALGLGLHFVIALLIVLVCYGVARLAPGLVARPLVAGPVYGLAAYLVMNYVVIPLSAARSSRPSLPVLVNGLLIHAIGVGIPSVVAARAALSRARR
jgi:hypothetical protein